MKQKHLYFFIVTAFTVLLSVGCADHEALINERLDTFAEAISDGDTDDFKSVIYEDASEFSGYDNDEKDWLTGNDGLNPNADETWKLKNREISVADAKKTATVNCKLERSIVDYKAVVEMIEVNTDLLGEPDWRIKKFYKKGEEDKAYYKRLINSMRSFLTE